MFCLLLVLENIKKFFTIALKKEIPYQPHKNRLRLFNLLFLENRRKISDLATFYRIITNKTQIILTQINFCYFREERHQAKAMHQSDINVNSFINRISNHWNIFSYNKLMADNVEDFKIRHIYV